jgi:hypothetical protein
MASLGYQQTEVNGTTFNKLVTGRFIPAPGSAIGSYELDARQTIGYQ